MTADTTAVRDAGRDVPPVAIRRQVNASAAFTEEIRDSVRLLAGCLGATGAAAVLLHFVTVWAG
jgi:hypothetical protein